MKYYELENTFGETSGELPKGAEELTFDEYHKALNNITNEANKVIAELNKQGIRVSELQDKAILEGLTDTEKEEYKKLKGGE